MKQTPKISKHVLKECYKAGQDYRIILLLDNVDAFTEVECNDIEQFERQIYIWWGLNKDELARSKFKVYLYELGAINEIELNKIQK